ncbi:hypothetical protein [Nocardioides marmotae]|uniref:Uncharacterized protein n=1 Tax=Nocardioides marmotae TaxID=2663857 RepID=A0A6I3JBS4_9ACTN|nr:hypothetical protein [Nocardioides marmotae]MBC9732097.1 hypothetical protein [Nocardioides marmotae]MTB83218.1 hypothetical protein [Nocardioides marmotae]MTB95602.1 hypothetical protein [Nocardioides marmotae]QKE01020.1 hypothetical protein HPC71_08000 [Nocardioides marmotae]
MSTTHVTSARTSDGAAPRVRHQAREAAALMAFSALSSIGLAATFLLLTRLGG